MPGRNTISLIALLLTLSSLAIGQTPEADQDFTFGYRLFQRGEKQLSAEAFNSFVRKHATDVRVNDALYYLALLARDERKLQAAQSFLARIQTPKHVPPNAIRLLKGQVALETSNPAEALKELEQVEPTTLPDLQAQSTWKYLLGLAYRGVGNLAAASTQFQEAIKNESSVQGLAYFELGKAQSGLEQEQQGIESLRKAASMAPIVAADARVLAANLAYKIKQYDLAAQLYGEIVTHHNTAEAFQPALVGRMRALQAAGHHDQVIERYEQVKDLIKVTLKAEALHLYGLAQFRTSKFMDSARTFQTIIIQHQGYEHLDEVSYMLIAGLFKSRRLDMIDKAAEQLAPLMAKSTRRFDVQYLRAQALIAEGKSADAIKHLGTLANDENSPHASRALLQRAVLFDKTSNVESALADYKLFTERYAEDMQAAAAAQRAVEIAFRAELFEDVVAIGAKWLDHKDIPQNTHAAMSLQLAISYIKLDKKEEALTVLDKTLAGDAANKEVTLAKFYRGLVLASKSTAMLPEEGQDEDPLKAQERRKILASAVTSLHESLAGELPDAQQTEAWRLLSQLNYVAGEITRAVEAFEMLRQRQPKDQFDSSTAMWMGSQLQERSEWTNAIWWLTIPAEDEEAPRTARDEALFRIAVCYAKTDDWENAAVAYINVRDTGREFAERGQLGYALSLSKLKRLDEAVVEYDKLHQADSKPVVASSLLESGLLRMDRANRHQQAGNAAQAQTDRADAVKQLNRVVILYSVPELDAVWQPALLELGSLAMLEQNVEQARKHYNELITKAPKSEWAKIATAEMKLVDGKRAECVFLLKKIAENEKATREATRAKWRLAQLGE